MVWHQKDDPHLTDSQKMEASSFHRYRANWTVYYSSAELMRLRNQTRALPDAEESKAMIAKFEPMTPAPKPRGPLSYDACEAMSREVDRVRKERDQMEQFFKTESAHIAEMTEARKAAEAYADINYDRLNGSYPNPHWTREVNSFLRGWIACVACITPTLIEIKTDSGTGSPPEIHFDSCYYRKRDKRLADEGLAKIEGIK